MKNRLLRFLDAHLGHLVTAAGVLLYLALLAKLPPAVVGLAALLLTGLALRWLQTRAGLGTRLRADTPLLLLGGAIVLALALRQVSSPHAIPAPQSDEAHFVSAALEIIRSGSYLPASLRHPSLLVYVELGSSVLRFVVGAGSNLWTWPSELVAEHLYGWGRATVMLIGAATLVPLFRIGERLYGRRIGLLAALFLALLPLHVAASGIVTPQVLAALLALLATGFSLRLLEEGRPRWALWAGLCAGLAAATHYPAGLAVVVPPLAALLRREKRSSAAPAADQPILVLLSLVAALAAFVAACPALLFAPNRLATGLTEAVGAYFIPPGRAGSGLRYLVLEGLGIGPTLLVVAGGLVLLPRLRRREIVLLAYPLLTYLALLVPGIRFPRDLALLAPWLALLAAVGVDRLTAWAQEQRPRQARWIPWAAALLGGALFVIALL